MKLKLPHRLPRDTAQTLFMLAILVGVITPHMNHLPAWCIAVALSLLAWRAALAWMQSNLPSRRVVWALLVMAFGLTWLTHHTFFSRDAGVTLAAILVGVKTLESRSWRDTFVVFLIGIFLVLTQFLYSQSLFMLVGMVVAVWGLLTLLVLAQARVQPMPSTVAAAIVARMALWGAPFTVALFVLFPRIEPIWGIPQGSASGTGLSDQIQLGSISALATDESIAMHVRFTQGTPEVQNLYFRGVVLGEFDGAQWRKRTSSQPLSTREFRETTAQRQPVLRYQFKLEPQLLNVVPTLETTTRLQPEGTQPVQLWQDWIWKTPNLLTHAHSFEAQAQYPLNRGPLAFDPTLRQDLALPEGHNPRLHAYAQSLLQHPAYAQATAQTWIDLLMTQLRTQGYRYTLTPGLYGAEDGRDALDEFWFDGRAGFCEHFASTVAVLLRELGVPSRLVLGFQGAEYNPVGGYHVVRNSHAHAWVEYWQADVGWSRLDPTTAIPVEQISTETQLRPPPGIVTVTSLQAQNALARALRHRMEAMSYAWNEWVLNYSNEQQMSLLSWLGFSMPSMRVLVWMLVGVLLGALLMVLLALSRQRSSREDLWLQTYRQMCQRLTRAGRLAEHAQTFGFTHGEHVPPRTLAHQLTQIWGASGEPLADVLLQMEALRYSPLAQDLTRRQLAAKLHLLSKTWGQALQNLAPVSRAKPPPIAPA